MTLGSNCQINRLNVCDWPVMRTWCRQAALRGCWCLGLCVHQRKRRPPPTDSRNRPDHIYPLGHGHYSGCYDCSNTNKKRHLELVNDKCSRRGIFQSAELGKVRRSLAWRLLLQCSRCLLFLDWHCSIYREKKGAHLLCDRITRRIRFLKGVSSVTWTGRFKHHNTVPFRRPLLLSRCWPGPAQVCQDVTMNYPLWQHRAPLDSGALLVLRSLDVLSLQWALWAPEPGRRGKKQQPAHTDPNTLFPIGTRWNLTPTLHLYAKHNLPTGRLRTCLLSEHNHTRKHHSQH